MAYQPQDISLPESFSRGMEKVIQPQESPAKGSISGRPQGKGAASTGNREKPLAGIRRVQGPSFENGYSEPDDAMRGRTEADRNIGRKAPYRSIVVDEARILAPGVPAHPRMVPEEKMIFSSSATPPEDIQAPGPFPAAAIEVRGRSRKLRINYRTTE
jgi:hypothetical protein